MRPARLCHPPAARPSRRANAEGAVAERVLPNVPQSARQSIRGSEEAVVRIWVDRNGRVRAGKISRPAPSNYYARVALRAAKTWNSIRLSAAVIRSRVSGPAIQLPADEDRGQRGARRAIERDEKEQRNCCLRRTLSRIYK